MSRSIRLNSSIRHRIVNALLDHRFGEEEKKLVKEKRAFQEAVYAALHAAEDRALIDALPKRVRENYIKTDGDALVEFGGDTTRVYWGDPRPFGHDPHSVAAVFDAAHPLTELHRRIKRDEENLKERRRTLKHQARFKIDQSHTAAGLVRDWPEVEPFLKLVLNVAEPEAPVPAVINAELNAALGLPVEGTLS